MTILEKIEQIKPKINYDFNQVIRDTLFPIDQFVKKATLEAIDFVATRCRIIEKSVFIPLVYGIRYSDVVLTTLSKSKFNISQPKSLVIFNSSNAVEEVDQAYLEELVSNKYTDLVKMGFFVQGSTFQIRTSVNIDNLTTSGAYNSILTIPDTDELTGSTAFVAGDVGKYIINLEFADKGLYEYRKILSVNAGVATIEGTSINTTWALNSKLYVVTLLPLMLLFTFQGTPTPDYFSTETTIPIQEQFIHDLDNIIMRNLFQYIAVRDPKQLQVYEGLIKTGILTTPDVTVTNIKKRLNSRVTNPVVECYLPYTEYYGR